MALRWNVPPEPIPPKGDPPPDDDIAKKLALHAGNIAAAVVIEQFKIIEALKIEVGDVLNEVQKLREQITFIAPPVEPLPCS